MAARNSQLEEQMRELRNVAAARAQKQLGSSQTEVCVMVWVMVRVMVWVMVRVMVCDDIDLCVYGVGDVSL